MLFHIIDNKNINIIKEASVNRLQTLFRKCSIKFQRANNHLWFLAMCKSKKVTPNFVKVYTNSTSKSAVKAIDCAKKKWVEEERKHWFKKRDSIGETKRFISSELMAKLSPLQYKLAEDDILDLVREEGHHHYLKLSKKLKSLVQKSIPMSRKPLGQTVDLLSLNVVGPINNMEVNRFPVYDVKCDFYPRFKNLSHLYLQNSEEKLLNMGFKHSFSSSIGEKDILDLAADCEVALSTRSTSYRMQKRKCSEILREVKKQGKIQKVETSILKKLRKKIEDNNLVICKADKGNTVTILNRSDYVEKMKSYVIENNLVVTKEKNILGKYIAQVRKCTSECPNLLANVEKIQNPQIPKLYGLPKIHKVDQPLRPVVSCTQAPNVEVCKRLVAKLPDLIKFHPKRSLKNSQDFINKTKNLVISSNAKLISFDVKNLFPSVPVDEVKTLITNRISHLSEVLQKEVKKSLEICLSQNFCTFMDQTFEIKSGLPIGSPISPLMADIFMDHIEEKIFSSGSPWSSRILHWFRYVDDIFVVVVGSWRQIGKLLGHLNRVHPNIIFTLEKEINGKLNFLDLGVRKEQKRLLYNIYRKETFTDCVINKRSNHPLNIKYAAFHSMLHRLISVPMDVDHYLKELGTIHQIAKNNGYKSSEINAILVKKLRDQRRQAIYANVPKSSDKSWRKIRYLNESCLKIGEELKKAGVQPAYYNDNTIGKYLINNKPKSSIKEKSGIYSVECKDCDAKYIGMTMRSLNTRMKEHLSGPSSHVHKHMIETGHRVEMDNVSLLHHGSKWRKLCCLESMYITEATDINQWNMLNGQLVPSNYSPLLDLCAWFIDA
uniref:Reverse transcriptase domain-containing protein n=1 Tax=Cacopsylla melanoneura TaxID=428564 RepID=A0A8D8PLV0_9HEMI